MAEELSASLKDTEVVLAGWIAGRRDHGGLIFLDLRDKTGVVQLTCNPELNKSAWEVAEILRDEYVVVVKGMVRERPQAMINKAIGQSGEIELEVTDIRIESTAKALPFVLGDATVNEDTRLAYRFLDLRTAGMQNMLKVRAEFIDEVRAFMKGQGFTEVQTPILANSSPEGARDFLVPSRLHPGKFYALPQAPQQYKQLLMVGGLEKYFQIAPCFRDEDPRADRHAGDFYQIDVEMSFVEQEDVLQLGEELMKHLSKFAGKKIQNETFPRFTWRESMNKFGTDKPDIRYDFFISDVSDIVKNSEFKVFSDVVKKGGAVHALRAEGAGTFSRGDIAKLEATAKEGHGLGGLAYMMITDSGVESPILKFLGDDVVKHIVTATEAKAGDALFFGAGDWLSVCKALGDIRKESAKMLGALEVEEVKNILAWCWVIDFPMYEKNAETGAIEFSHNPFSMPKGGMEALETTKPEDITAYQYDLVVNGFEISSGAIRNHKIDVLYKAFEIAGYTKEETDAKFGGMIRAFEYGVPPHGGFAPGIDRLLMVLLNVDSIRDIYAFPKNGKGQDLMMNSPSEVSAGQLRDLHIEIAQEKKS